jgi:hypothetical protein
MRSELRASLSPHKPRPPLRASRLLGSIRGAPGTVFDATYRRGRPFKFKLGTEMVIGGLDSAVSQLSVGERAKITIG